MRPAGALGGMTGPKPRGAKIQIAVDRVKHKVPDAQYQGVMLTNPGGPGGSQRDLELLERKEDGRDQAGPEPARGADRGDPPAQWHAGTRPRYGGLV